jgi:hypothetical protein
LPIRFRAEVMEPGEDFDQTGFERKRQLGYRLCRGERRR